MPSVELDQNEYCNCGCLVEEALDLINNMGVMVIVSNNQDRSGHQFVFFFPRVDEQGKTLTREQLQLLAMTPITHNLGSEYLNRCTIEYKFSDDAEEEARARDEYITANNLYIPIPTDDQVDDSIVVPGEVVFSTPS